MLTPLVHDLLVAYATTLGALLRADRDDAFLRAFLRREFLDAEGDLYGHLWKFAGGRMNVGRLTVSADSEGSVSIRTRGRAFSAEQLAPSEN